MRQKTPQKISLKDTLIIIINGEMVVSIKR